MRKHHLMACAALIAVGALAGAVAAKDPPGGGKAGGLDQFKPKPEAGKGEHGKPGESAADKDKGAGNDDKDKDKGKDKDDKGDDKAHGPGHHHGAMHEIFEELKAGKLKKAELKDRLAKLHERSSDRAAEHRKELKDRWGAALAMPAVRQELEHHGRRLARLNRALILAQTEVTKDKDKLIERIEKLIDKENARHEAAMQRFKSMPTTPAASAGPAASAAPASSKAGAP